MTVGYSLCDGDRALVRRNQLKIDLYNFVDITDIIDIIEFFILLNIQ